MDFIYIKKSMQLLDIKHYRTFKKWCKSKGVIIIKEPGRKRKFINRIQFENARIREFVLELKIQHGSEWEEVLNLYLNNEVVKLMKIETRTESAIRPNLKKINLISQENQYLSRLQKKISEL